MPSLHRVHTESQPVQATARARADAIIDLGTTLVVTGYTKAQWIPTDKSLLSVTAVLMSPGSTSTLAQIIKNGIAFDTMTIGPGETIASIDVEVDFVGDDLWSMYITQAGTSSRGLTFYGTFSS
jgi:hypothetical protein